jgi:hypothetical protein
VRVDGLVWVYGQRDHVICFAGALVSADVADTPVDLEHDPFSALIGPTGTVAVDPHVSSTVERCGQEAGDRNGGEHAGRGP